MLFFVGLLPLLVLTPIHMPASCQAVDTHNQSQHFAAEIQNIINIVGDFANEKNRYFLLIS